MACIVGPASARVSSHCELVLRDHVKPWWAVECLHDNTGSAFSFSIKTKRIIKFSWFFADITFIADILQVY